jgi:hypothetical protein
MFLEFTERQLIGEWPIHTWLMVPSDKFYARLENSVGREQDITLQLMEQPWLVHVNDIAAAAAGYVPLNKLVPYVNTKGAREEYAFIPRPLKKHQMNLWRQQMEQVRRSVLGDAAVEKEQAQQKQQRTLAGRLATLYKGSKQKLRQLFVNEQEERFDVDGFPAGWETWTPVLDTAWDTAS